MKLSIVVPVFNERDLAPQALARIEAAPLPEGVVRELVLIDDCSTDGTREWLRDFAAARPDVILKLHEKNAGNFVIVQDADLEYDPREIPTVLEPLLDGRADAVFGTRFLGHTHRVLYYWHSVGNWLLTTLSNMLSNVNLTDMECCYKAFRREVLTRIDLKEDRFGFEPEITAKVARLGCRIYEVPVSYSGRTYAEGKKINWKDGFSALRCILQYNLLG
jgi:glycosyltransferase involved in cell wall biosynthesis